MSAQEKHINQSDLTDEQLDRMVFALVSRLSKLFVVEKPMTAKQAAAFLDYNPDVFRKFVRAGKFRAHKPGKEARYIPSEMIEDLKKM